MNAHLSLDRLLPSEDWQPNSVDFSRDVVCVFGLPFDVMTLDAAVAQVRASADTRRRLMISTANLNFVVAAQQQPQFRQSVVHSDLSLADGMPIVWAAKALGLAVPERAPGAGLFERLWAGPSDRPVRVYFFGAPPGVAEAAAERVNQRGGGVVCVGFDPAGFGPVESMSTPEQLQRINAAKPDFVVVSLGAAKGQAWIERNRALLEAPVISHLGAVVGFAAGVLARAPAWVQALGLEWLWRIKEEPHLWRRYAKDAVALSRLMVTSVLPLLWARWTMPTPAATCEIAVQADAQSCTLSLRGHLTRRSLDKLRPALQQAAASGTAVVIRADGLLHIDAYAMAQLLLLSGHLLDAGLPLGFQGVSPALQRLFRCHCTEHLLSSPDREPSERQALGGVRPA